MKEQKLTIIMYHYVRDLKNSRYPSIKGLDTELFRGQVEYLYKHYNFVTVEQIIAAFDKEEQLPSKAVLLTFDDAYIDHFTNVFPILHKKNIQGAFFPPVKAITQHRVLDVNKIHFILASIENTSVLLDNIKLLLNEYQSEYNLEPYDYYFEKLAQANRFDAKEVIFVKRLLQVELDESLRLIFTDRLFSKFVSSDEEAFSRELYMSEDQIECMVNSGMHIGSHGYDHYWLGSLSKEKQELEIQESIKFIQKVGGDIDNWTIGYPYGNYNEDTISLLKKYNCKLGFTTKVDVATLSELSDDIKYKLPRLDTNDLPKNKDSNTNEWFREG
ncbi:polysaccharide deacetylase family protein [Dysgonomonas sp. HGC4]|uniref:polysaccharide deacetylase family protein n=1 Tax=Dysgonomonas sp. HGC4 TaxID=1658009 RepID=UPI0006820455|nr:polysaccharide deacetylase family protein [Dysgonomonas sp. HGC4]MBD8349074.1 polysaccharide deacetylase family protein [Dysgonomonas sp. HGC4]